MFNIKDIEVKNRTPREQLLVDCIEQTKLPRNLEDLFDKIYKDELIFYRQKHGYDPVSNSDDSYKVRNDAFYKFIETPDYKKYIESIKPIIKNIQTKFINTPRVKFNDPMDPREFSKSKFDREEYNKEFYKGLTKEQIQQHQQTVKEQLQSWNEHLEEIRLRNIK